jgi:hypothetical protein
MSVQFANHFQLNLANRNLDEIMAQLQSFVTVILYSVDGKINYWNDLSQVPSGFTLVSTNTWPKYYVLRSSETGEEIRLSYGLAMQKMTGTLY